MPLYRFSFPGKHYAPAVQQFKWEFARFLSARRRDKRAFPIARIFELLPINVESSNVLNRLKDRGDFVKVTSSKIDNSGENVQAVFIDDYLGKIVVPFERSVQAVYKLEDDNFTLSFPKESQSADLGIIVYLMEAYKELEISAIQVLRKVSVGNKEVMYFFEERADSNNRIILKIDLTMPYKGTNQIYPYQDLIESTTPVDAFDIVDTFCWCLTKDKNGDPTDHNKHHCDADWCVSADCITSQLWGNPPKRRYSAWFEDDVFAYYGGNPDKLIGKIAKIYNSGTCRGAIIPGPGDGPIKKERKYEYYRLKVTSIHTHIQGHYITSVAGDLVK